MTPTRTLMTVAAWPKPRMKGAAIAAGPARVSTPAWTERGTYLKMVIARTRIRTYVRCMCDAGHTQAPPSACRGRYFPQGEPSPGRLRDRRARPRPLARERRRGDPG